MKNIFIVFFLVLGLSVFPATIRAEEIARFEEYIAINSDATVAVSERIHYDFGSEARHGIFRTIPTIKVNEEGKKFILDFKDFGVSDPKGNTYDYVQTNTDGTISLKIGDPDKTITGKYVYDIKYAVSGALTYFSDHDELYWNITGNGWDVPIREVVGQIVLPADVAMEDVKIICFTGYVQSSEQNCKTSYNARAKTVYVQTTKPLEANEGLTVAVSFPKGIVAVVEPRQYIPFWETTKGKILIAVLVCVAFFWYIVAPLVLPFLWWKYGRDPKPVIGEATAWFEPPRGKWNRILTPGETGTLIDERADNADITATLIDLARRGYIKILEKTKGNIELKKGTVKVKLDALEPFEKTLLDGIFKTKDLVALKGADLTKVVTDTKNKLYDSVVIEGFFPKNPQTVRGMYTLGSVMALMTGNFLLFLSMLFFGYHMPRKSILGAGAAARGRALRNFITSQERQFKFMGEKQVLFEKMLPFAIAFGVEKLWIARFAQMHLKSPTWYSGYSTHFHAIAFADSLSKTSSGVVHAATPVSSSGHSSGFSGGSSGGGGGGGGGGSW